MLASTLSVLFWKLTKCFHIVSVSDFLSRSICSVLNSAGLMHCVTSSAMQRSQWKYSHRLQWKSSAAMADQRQTKHRSGGIWGENLQFSLSHWRKTYNESLLLKENRTQNWNNNSLQFQKHPKTSALVYKWLNITDCIMLGWGETTVTTAQTLSVMCHLILWN